MQNMALQSHILVLQGSELALFAAELARTPPKPLDLTNSASQGQKHRPRAGIRGGVEPIRGGLKHVRERPPSTAKIRISKP